MTTAELEKAKDAFEARINSLEVDTEKCLSESTPGFAFFPAVLYSFATLDHFSSYWAGWNAPGSGRNQTDRMVAFLERFLRYPSKESQIAVNIWRHKLMHTGEPRVLQNATSPERYLWSTGRSAQNHMKLVATSKSNELLLHFAPLVFCRDVREAVFGQAGYFQELSSSPTLQANWKACDSEFESYRITLKP